MGSEAELLGKKMNAKLLPGRSLQDLSAIAAHDGKVLGRNSQESGTHILELEHNLGGAKGSVGLKFLYLDPEFSDTERMGLEGRDSAAKDYW